MTQILTTAVGTAIGTDIGTDITGRGIGSSSSSSNRSSIARGSLGSSAGTSQEGLEDADRAGRRRTADIGIVGLLDIVTTLLLGGNILDLLIRVNIFIGNIGNIVAPIFGNIIVGGVGLGGGGYFERTDIEISAAETGTGTGGAGATTEEEAGAALRGGRQYRPLTTPSTTTIVFCNKRRGG